MKKNDDYRERRPLRLAKKRKPGVTCSLAGPYTQLCGVCADAKLGADEPNAMISPRPAPARPRVISSEINETVLLEDLVGWCIEQGYRGAIEVVGGPRTGKTSALSHLASLAVADQLLLLDDPSPRDVKLSGPKCLIVYTTRRPFADCDLSYQLASWTDDDLIEYLLSSHPDRCASVAARFMADGNKHSLLGNPELYTMIADQMAANEAVQDIRTAVRLELADRMEDEQTREDAQFYAAAVLLGEQDLANGRAGRMFERGVNRELFALLSHRWVQVLLSADWVISVLKKESPEHPFPKREFSGELVVEAARLAKEDPTALSGLRKLVECRRPEFVPMAASMLHLADPEWRPNRALCFYFRGAHLANAQWREIDLGQTNLERADLRYSDLQGANLKRSRLAKSTLRGSKLGSVQLIEATAHETDFSMADLTRADMTRGQFDQADFAWSVLKHVSAVEANFHSADFSDACLRSAILAGCDFRDATLNETDLQDADLRGANLSRQNLRGAILRGANLSNSLLSRCDLEFVELPNANFAEANLTNAWLTGSMMPGANFRNAKLCHAGLADVEWEQADLRGADLRGCSFHMGSSRSGLVGSPYPGHGSRTGFYTNDYDDQCYKAPEEIRHANLCGTDLRGSVIEGVDFYLVDLRGAKYDAGQAKQFRQCDAILSRSK